MYPDPDNSATNIYNQRQYFSNAVLQTVDADIYYANKYQQYSPLFKQCNSTWRNQVMQYETLCQARDGGSFVTSLAMGLNAYNILLNDQHITPSNLNQWFISMDAYQYNQVWNKSIVTSISNRIQYIGHFIHADIDEIKQFLNGQSIVIGWPMRSINQYPYGGTLNIYRYVNIIGYSTQHPHVFIARDPFLYQQRFDYYQDFHSLNAAFTVYNILD